MGRMWRVAAAALAGLVVDPVCEAEAATSNRLAIPLVFERNVGQAAPAFDFVAHAGGRVLLFGTPDHLIVQDDGDGPVTMRLVGARPVRPDAGKRSPTRVYYFRGNDPDRWLRNVPAAKRIAWREVYPDIDLVCYAQEGNLEYDFLVRPGGNAANIRLRFDGARSLTLDADGALRLETANGVVHHRAPHVYQARGDRRVPVPGAYRIRHGREAVFDVADWDRSRNLVIDPVVEFSTYLGGSSYDYGRAVAVAPDGGIVLVGESYSSSLAGIAPATEPSGSYDITVCKLAADGSSAEFLAFVGGTGVDMGRAVAVAADGTIIVGGHVYGTGFPLVNPIRSVPAGLTDGCLFRLAADGSALLWSTYFGGNGDDYVNDVELDGAGNVFFAGNTSSSDLPLANAFQTTPAKGYVSVLAPDHTLAMCSYLGTLNAGQLLQDIALDPQTNVLIVGQTADAAFPTYRAYQPSLAGLYDGFLMKITRADWSVDFSTYLGGSKNDYGMGVAADSASRIYVAGYTESTNFPLVAALDSAIADFDGFLCRFAPDGQSLPFSTFLGEYAEDGLLAVTVNGDDEAMVAGWTRGPPITWPYGWEQKTSTGREVLYARLAQDASAWRDMAVFGGGNDQPEDIAVAANGDALLVGSTSTNFPCDHALQPAFAGDLDGFVTRLSTNTVRQIPYLEGFEFGRLDSRWLNGYNAYTTTLFEPHGGRAHLRLITRPSVYHPGKVDLVLDLSGHSGIRCSFWHKSSNPEWHTTPMPAAFTNSCLGNGVAFSADGTNWFRLCATTQADGLSTNYTQRSFDLDAAVAAVGLDYSQPLHLRFRAQDDGFASSYVYYDDIAVVGTTLAFREETLAVTEGSNAVLTVVREGPYTGACSVDYATIAGTAQPGTDYVTTTGTLSFAAGQVTNQFTVATIDNAFEDAIRPFTVRLQNPVGVDLGAPSLCTVSVVDDEESLVFPVRCGFESGVFNPTWEQYTEDGGRVEVNSNMSPVPEGTNIALLACSGTSSNNGLAELTLPIDLAGRTNVYLRFHAARTSFAGEDNADMVMPASYTGHGRYVGAALSADGNTWYKVAGLSTLEGVGSTFQLFEITLDPILAAHGLSYSDGMRIRFCIGNTNPSEPSWLQLDLVEMFSPSFDFEPAAHTGVEYDGTVDLTVLRKGKTNVPAAVAYSTRNGSAVAGSDFTAAGGTLSFAAGQVSNTVTVTLSNDAAAESNEVFYVDLSSPSTGFAVGINGTAEVLVQDDDRSPALPFQDDFSTDLSHWATHGRTSIQSGALFLDGPSSGEPPSAAMLAVDPAGATNLTLRFRAYYYYIAQTPMPDTYTGLNGGDGVAFSADGVTWHKLVAFEEDAQAWRDWRVADVNLDPFLTAAGITPGTPFKLRFEAHTWGHLEADDVTVFSRMPLGVAPVTLPGATGMVAYAASLTSSNAVAPATWSVVDGLPAGLNLSTDGRLAGAPTEEGSFTPTFAVVDAWGSAGTGTVSLLVAENPNRPPYATFHNPTGAVVPMAEQTNRLFTLEAADPEGVPLTYTWALDGTPVSSQPTNYLYATAWGDAGTHQLDVRVSDGLWNNVLASWQVEVTADNDGDGMSNAWERSYGLDPWSAADATEDPDGDYLVNTQECALGTSPIDPDTNGDSLNDGWSEKFGHDPLDTSVIPRMTLTRRGDLPSYTGTWDRVAAIGDAVYVARGTNGFDVIDASDPDAPAWHHTWGSFDSTYDVAVTSNRVFSCDGTNGLVKFDASDPLDLSPLIRYTFPPARVAGASLNGNLALVKLYDVVEDLQVLDVTDGAPSPSLGYLHTTNGWRDAAWSGPFVYLSGGDEEFGVLDLSTPSSPVLRGTLPLPVGYQGWQVANGQGQVFLSWQDRVSAIDVTDPDAPSVIVTNDLPGGAQVMAMQNQGGFVFVGRDFLSSGSGLSLYDGADTTWTQTVAESSADWRVNDLFATRDRVYLVDETNGLVVYTYVGDYDEDGLPDAWEWSRLGTLAYGPDDDPDGDLVTNLGEWRAWLDPLKADTDGDTLTDGWEIRYLMDPAGSNTVVDTDGDGLTDRAEQHCRTNPLDPGDHLRLDGAAGTAGTAGIRWWGMSGVTYRVDRSWDLDGWSPAPGGPAPDGTNPRTPAADGLQQYVDPDPLGDTNVFYRLNAPE